MSSLLIVLAFLIVKGQNNVVTHTHTHILKKKVWISAGFHLAKSPTGFYLDPAWFQARVAPPSQAEFQNYDLGLISLPLRIFSNYNTR